MQAKVHQMIQYKEQRARELEQEITLMQGEGQYNLQRGPPISPALLQQYVQVGDPFIPQRGPLILLATAFQWINYLDKRSPLAPQLQASPWPAERELGLHLFPN
jgi:hypothetical protein